MIEWNSKTIKNHKNTLTVELYHCQGHDKDIN